MKKIQNIALAAFVALAAVACTSETSEPNDPGGQTPGENTFTFTLPSSSSVITYAGEVAASDNEKKLDLANTSILMFDEAGTLEAIVDGALIAAGTNPDGKATATIAVPDSWKGDKTFYLIGNTQMDAYDNLPEAGDISTMTATEFLELTTEAQDGPISSTNGLLMSGVVPVTDIEQSAGSDITLYRSVARFDVDQDVTLNKVIVKSISVYDANTSGYIVAYGRGVKASGLTTGEINGIAVSQTLTLVDVLGTPEDDTDDHNFQKQEGAFYLYPTYLETDGTGTTISLVGEVNGRQSVYTLNKEESELPVDLEILANTRYLISSIDELTHTFTITVAEWDEGDPVVGRPGDSKLFGLLADPTGSAVEAYATNVITLANAGGQINFTVKATGSQGTYYKLEWEDGYNYTGKFDVNYTNASTVSYGVPYFASTYTIDVEKMYPFVGSQVKMTIYDAKNPENTLELLLDHPVDNDTPVSAEVLFPDAALRAVLATEYGLAGDEFTGEQLAAMTSIDIAENVEITSLEGLQYLPNLTTILAQNCTGITEPVDFSGRSNWQQIVLWLATNIADVVVGDQPNLGWLSISSKYMTSLDVSGYPLLHRLNLEEMPILELDLSNNPILDTIVVTKTRISRLDLSDNPKIKYAGMNNTPMETLIMPDEYVDLSVINVQNTHLKTFELKNAPLVKSINTYDCPYLETIDIETTGTATNILLFNNPSLKTLNIGSYPAVIQHYRIENSGLDEIDLAGCTLTNFYAGSRLSDGIFIRENLRIVMSGPEHASLNFMDVRGIRNLEFVVSDSFPIDDPESQFSALFAKTAGTTATFTNLSGTTKVYNY